ncbi:MAG: ATP-grasp domain-containing protein [Candidatus Oxydemutatoraceae bacterium WSBS_2016_MAG_OTU14]
MLKIGIMTDEVAWHSKNIANALSERGCEVFFASLPEHEFSNLERDGREQQVFKAPTSDLSCGRPDAIFVRCIPYGSFEQVTFYLTVLHAYEEQGILVYNSASMIERTVDKVMTSFLLHHAGLPVPPTWAGLNAKRANQVVDEQIKQGHAVVVKPIFGAQGKGLQYVDCRTPRPYFDVDAVFYIQRFIPPQAKQYCDWRVLVINGRTVASMKRIGSSWINNVAQGAECVAETPRAELSKLAEQACLAIGIDYAGVDIMLDAEGKAWVIEVNSIPAWQGLQGVVDFDIAGKLADGLLERLGQKDGQKLRKNT